jgi:hypothetical protein
LFTLFSNLINLIDLYFDTIITTLPSSIINLRNIINITDIENKTPQQKQYYDWIKSGKISNFNEYYDDVLIKSALKCS